ncbi:PREDICTED: serine/threonine-protein phosphatase 2A regulatory subunit B'' subunit beta-like [Branchiostoma belcheri]|uniref:Serine/threonine-protein phosphatase 2A regulatory subunit B'' subunit beta-like n=1 Tax=Branchiostoma belcheri TaxID=7741 RepID=A0A6P4ZIM3_BRABE|nr:PREDICTED: serine/threonine-protein phosphatase 2A regulatory subunit B'' subunit beta-like [Branchiostoma belcheri]
MVIMVGRSSGGLTPVLKLKVDELFIQWLSDPDTQQDLRETLQHVQLGEGDLLITSSPQKAGVSPRSLRPASPSTPPASPTPGKMVSPRSPRRRSFKRQLPKTPPVKEKPKGTPVSSVGARIPQFYFPLGRPSPNNNIETILQRIKQTFETFKDGKVFKSQFAAITKACGCPLYWKAPLFLAGGGDRAPYVTASSFIPVWRNILTTCHDDASKFIRLLAKPQPGNTKGNYIVAEDVIPFVQDLIDTHPGLLFLQEAQEFHSRYLHTVIARIFYNVNRSWSGKITVPELRKSNLLQVIATLEEEEDINQITDYFSYEHFYVIYCKFWELDTDHDLYISKDDLSRHNDGALSPRILDRIFSGAVTMGNSIIRDERMGYPDFVWFLLSEEDKRYPTAVEYWFRCMDLDGDGILSMYELEYFYEEQYNKMEQLGIEPMPFEDCLCSVLDMVKPRREGKITLADLKACKMTHIFFDTFFNLDKYLDHEQRDPFAAAKEAEETAGMSDWEKYAAEEYEMLVAEENASGGQGQDPYDDQIPEEDSGFDFGVVDDDDSWSSNY